MAETLKYLHALQYCVARQMTTDEIEQDEPIRFTASTVTEYHRLRTHVEENEGATVTLRYDSSYADGSVEFEGKIDTYGRKDVIVRFADGDHRVLWTRHVVKDGHPGARKVGRDWTVVFDGDSGEETADERTETKFETWSQKDGVKQLKGRYDTADEAYDHKEDLIDVYGESRTHYHWVEPVETETETDDVETDGGRDDKPEIRTDGGMPPDENDFAHGSPSEMTAEETPAIVELLEGYDPVEAWQWEGDGRGTIEVTLSRDADREAIITLHKFATMTDCVVSYLTKDYDGTTYWRVASTQ